MLMAQKTTMSRFSLEVSERDAANGIYSAMSAVLESRGQQINFDAATRSHTLEIAKWLINPTEKCGLLLRGKYGNGKTTFLKALKWLIEFTTEITNGLNGKHIVKMLSAKQIADLCLGEESRKEYRRLFDEPILAIDDMGQEPLEVIRYGMIYNPVIDILLHRYDRQLMTLISTNLNSQELEAKYGGRIRDRLREMAKVIKFENSSYRK